MSDRPPRPDGAPAPRPDAPDVLASRLAGPTADALARRALAALPAAVGRADLDALAPPVGRLLAGRLDAALDQATPASPWVSGDRVEAALDAWRQAARAAVRIPAGEREAEVRQATERALAHLVRPAETLAAVAFEHEDGPLPAAVALGRTRAFGPYPYLPQIAERYVERKGLDHVDRAGLERLLLRIDRRMVSAFGADDWLALLAPLFEWVGPVGRPAGAVPADLLRPLLRAKGADVLADALDGLDAVDAETLRTLFARVLPAPSQDAAEAIPETAPASAPPPETSEDDLSGAAGPEPPASALPESEQPAPSSSEDPDEAPSLDDEAQADPAREEAGPSQPEPPASQPDADASALAETPGGDDFRPPVIGSRYGTPEFEGADESEVLGPPRPVSRGSREEDPMGEVREAVADEAPEPRSAPPVPVVDLPPPDGPRAPLAADEPDGPNTPGGADPEPADPEPDDQEEPDDEPLWMRLAHGRSPEPQPAPPTEADEDTPLWKRFAQSDLAERLPDPDPPFLSGSPAADASGAPGSPDTLEARVLGADAHERRDWFVAELFGGSPDDYRETLGAIDRAPTYTEATAVISAEILRKRSVSPYTDCAVAFIDAVQARFERR